MERTWLDGKIERRDGEKFPFKPCTCTLLILLLLQSVTGVESSDDHNSYWQVIGKTGKQCERG